MHSSHVVSDAHKRRLRSMPDPASPNRMRAIFFIVFMIAVALMTSEAIARLLLVAPGRFPAAQETPVIAEHATLGYTLRPGAVGHYSAGGYRAPIQMNEDALRDAPLAQAIQTDSRLLAVGDSFTMGLGVDAADTWPEQLERMLNHRKSRAAVVNAGVPGYSARQMRQVVEGLRQEVAAAGRLVRNEFRDTLAGRDRLTYYAPASWFGLPCFPR